MKFSKPQGGYDGPSNYLKIGDGEAVVVVLRGDIHDFQKTWPDGKTSQRYSVNAFLQEGQVFTPKIWEFGPTLYGKLAEINEVYPLEDVKIRVKRSGTMLDTEYNVMPLLNDKDKLTPKDMQKIENMDLHILDKPQKAPVSKPQDPEDGDNWRGL